MPGPTTTCPSRSISTNCWLGYGPCTAAAASVVSRRHGSATWSWTQWPGRCPGARAGARRRGRGGAGGGGVCFFPPPRYFDILYLLASHAGQVVTRLTILDE